MENLRKCWGDDCKLEDCLRLGIPKKPVDEYFFKSPNKSEFVCDYYIREEDDDPCLIKHHFNIKCNNVGTTPEKALTELMERVNMGAIELWGDE